MKNFHVSSLNLSYDIDQCTLRFLPETDLKLAWYQKIENMKLKIRMPLQIGFYLAHWENI